MYGLNDLNNSMPIEFRGYMSRLTSDPVLLDIFKNSNIPNIKNEWYPIGNPLIMKPPCVKYFFKMISTTCWENEFLSDMQSLCTDCTGAEMLSGWFELSIAKDLPEYLLTNNKLIDFALLLRATIKSWQSEGALYVTTSSITEGARK